MREKVQTRVIEGKGGIVRGGEEGGGGKRRCIDKTEEFDRGRPWQGAHNVHLSGNGGH